MELKYAPLFFFPMDLGRHSYAMDWRGKGETDTSLIVECPNKSSGLAQVSESICEWVVETSSRRIQCCVTTALK